jgi:hypothetical protein
MLYTALPRLLIAVLVALLGLSAVTTLAILGWRAVMESVRAEEEISGQRAVVRSLLLVIAIGAIGIAALFFPWLEKVHSFLLAAHFLAPILIAAVLYVYWENRRRRARVGAGPGDELGAGYVPVVTSEKSWLSRVLSTWPFLVLALIAAAVLSEWLGHDSLTLTFWMVIPLWSLASLVSLFRERRRIRETASGAG